MKDIFVRQLIMLKHIPRYPAKTTTRNLRGVLEEKGFKVTQRTVQRDLKAMAGVMVGLHVDGEKDYPGWSWSRDVVQQDIPAMDGNIALTFQLVDYFLRQMFPPSVLHQLKPYFDSAGNVLDAIGTSSHASWKDKIRVLSRTQQLIPAHVDENIIATISEALFKGKQVCCRYFKRSGDEVEYNLHPLGLVFRESAIYLVATMWDYHDPRHLALHRFKHCDLLAEDAVAQEKFNLDDYLASGSFGYGETENKLIRLEAVFFDGAGLHLFETPLSEDQEIEERDSGQLVIRATVQDSAQVRWWLLGFGGQVEVIKPSELREEFSNISEVMSNLYQDR